MKRTLKLLLSISALLLCLSAAAGPSVYTQKFDDPRGVFFTEKAFGIKADGKMDVTDALQAAVNDIKKERGFGTLYLPEGTYRISRTIYIPAAIRIIGYGKTRPVIVLGKNTPGFNEELNSMIWFTSGIVTDPSNVSDANAGTFYSALSNVDMRIEKGNRMAVALRTHYAQHCFISHVSINAGDAFACIYEVGNELEDVEFIGGRFGIDSDAASPGWPVMLTDVYFEGQKEAAVNTRRAGLVFVNMKVKNAPVGIRFDQKTADRLYVEDSYFENVPLAFDITAGEGATNQINVLNVFCKNVPTLIDIPEDGRKYTSSDKTYKVEELVYGLCLKEMGNDASYVFECKTAPAAFPATFSKIIPSIPDMSGWVSAYKYGAVGDGKADDTAALQKAIDENDIVFVPEGWYRLTGTLKLRKGSKVIGLHPFATQFILDESTPAFSGFGSPVPMVESSEGGDDFFSGIGICTGGYNNRAVGVKWMAGEKSYLNDVKFVGGHGTMSRPRPRPATAAQPQQNAQRQPQRPRYSSPDNPIAIQGLDQAWDNQYWSLWITNGGGGIFKDIWTANTYASAGLFVSHTHTPSKIYAMSLEHHVRYESRWSDVSNFKVYAMQYEEESREGQDAIAMSMDNCHDISFANTWFYRVSRVATPRNHATLVSDCSNIEFRNIRSNTTVMFENGSIVYDINKNAHIFPLDFAYARVKGDEASLRPEGKVLEAVKIGDNYEFATGAVSDSKGNVYFCEHRLRKIYKWDAATGCISTIADYPYKPFSLAVDTEDNLLVVCRYDRQPGYDAESLITIERLPDNATHFATFSGWSVLAFAITPDSPMLPLPLESTSSVNARRIIYPAHGLRGDFFSVYESHLPEQCFVAPDGETIIPLFFDLSRNIQLTAVEAGQKAPVNITWEDPRKTYEFAVNADGTLSRTGRVLGYGEYGKVTDADGNLYLAEGCVRIFSKDGVQTGKIELEERPLSLAIGGKDGSCLFVTTNNALYKVKLR